MICSYLSTNGGACPRRFSSVAVVEIDRHALKLGVGGELVAALGRGWNEAREPLGGLDGFEIVKLIVDGTALFLRALLFVHVKTSLSFDSIVPASAEKMRGDKRRGLHKDAVSCTFNNERFAPTAYRTAQTETEDEP